MSSLSKERIKDRMVKTAAKLWGVQDGDIENQFDPLLLLLVEACAGELERIDHDIANSNTRVFDLLANLILPETNFGASPASVVLQASPTESELKINASTNFHLSRQIHRPNANQAENVEINFTPIGSFRLLNATLTYILAGNKLFRYKENNDKEIVFANRTEEVSNTIWLALSCENLKSLEDLSLYFDLRGHSAAHTFYNALSYCSAKINDRPIDIKQGYSDNTRFDLDLEEILLSGYDKSGKMNRKAGFIYENRFVTITAPAEITNQTFPEELKSKLNPELVSQLESEKLVFLKIELPQYFQQDVLDALSCKINAFPAINKKLQSFQYRTNDWLNIIPLNVEGLFFDLLKISNEKGQAYKIIASSQSKEILAGEAIIRKTGVGKTDSAEVRNMINSIAESIRDQSAFFGHLTNQFILDRLSDIGKILAGLEDHISAAIDLKPEYNYLILRPKNKGELISIDYWMTNGADANQIKAGSLLQSSNHLINSKKAFTLTPVSGGKSSISNNDKKLILMQQLSSAGKVVSAEDIKLLCKQLFETKLKKVEVQKGVQVSAKKESGFERTIDVIVTLQQGQDASGDTDNLVRELEFILKNNASPVYPFRVILL